MKIHVTPEIMEAAYELLRVTQPFRGWRLPHADDIEFHVTRHVDRRGDCEDTGDGHIIRISNRSHDKLVSMLETMAHEMVHLKCFLTWPKDKAAHGARFKRLAKQVCRYHGFEEAIF